jgi:hypothetical protein
MAYAQYASTHEHDPTAANDCDDYGGYAVKRLWVIALMFGFGALSNAVELSTTLVSLDMGTIPIGTERRIEDTQGTSLRIIYHGAERAEITVDVQTPGSNVQTGYEPIPDPAWVVVRPSSFRIFPDQEVECEAVLTVPRDKRWRGRKYEVWLYTRLVPSQVSGVALHGGLRTRVRFLVP